MILKCTFFKKNIYLFVNIKNKNSESERENSFRSNEIKGITNKLDTE